MTSSKRLKPIQNLEVLITMYFDSIAKMIAERTGCEISAVKPESTFTELDAFIQSKQG